MTTENKRLSAEKVERIRRLWSSTPLSQTEIARREGVSKTTVSMTVLRKTHKIKKG